MGAVGEPLLLSNDKNLLSTSSPPVSQFFLVLICGLLGLPCLMWGGGARVQPSSLMKQVIEL